MDLNQLTVSLESEGQKWLMYFGHLVETVGSPELIAQHLVTINGTSSETLEKLEVAATKAKAGVDEIVAALRRTAAEHTQGGA